MLLEQQPDKPKRHNGSSPFVQVMNILARPVMEGHHIDDLHDVVGQKDWQSIPLPALHQEVLPLVRANAMEAGVPFEDIFQVGESGTTLIPSQADCHKSYLARRMHLSRLARSYVTHGVKRVVPIKGAAISRHMAAPSLRLMCDIDLLIPSDDLDKAASAMEEAGWSKCGSNMGHRHPSGWQVDIQTPVRPLGEAILWGSVETSDAPFHEAPVEYQAALLAIHCFQGHGEKIWRDVTDFRALMSSRQWDEERWNHARNLAARSGHLNAVDAFIGFCKSLDGHDVNDGSPASAELELHLGLLHGMAGEETSEISFHLLRQVQRPVGQLLRSLVAGKKSIYRAVGGASKQRSQPRGLYDIPKGRRIFMGCGLLLGRVWSTRTRRLHRLASQQKRCAVESLFISPDGRCPRGF